MSDDDRNSFHITNHVTGSQTNQYGSGNTAINHQRVHVASELQRIVGMLDAIRPTLDVTDAAQVIDENRPVIRASDATPTAQRTALQSVAAAVGPLANGAAIATAIAQVLPLIIG
ncbi:hypothetical protein [Streptomyces sp. NPDC047974]|uniref:hypothetical protein n=1 Tax=Streptomyces sp. NPDC047974 TaxID=3154343 RepID=UPI0033E56E5E